MKTLYESILDVDKNYDNDILISLLFSKDIQQRRDAFSTLLKMVESYRPKQHKNTAKMKSSDSYFVEFTYPIKYELSWRHTQPNFNPKASNTKLYEVPEELNGLFEQIQMKAYKYK